MNKRQRKKEQKKQDMFAAAFVSSYRELKQLDRDYHEYILSYNRKRPYDNIWDMYYDEFEDLDEQEVQDMRNKLLTEEEFIQEYCYNCGTQRCEGIGTEWFDGCKFKDQLGM